MRILSILSLILLPIHILAQIDTKNVPLTELQPIFYSNILVKFKEESKSNRIFYTLEQSNFKKGATIRLLGIDFEPGTHYFANNECNKILDSLAQILKSKPSIKIEIQGHICCRLMGFDGFDPASGKEDLSVQRALYVNNYLLKKEINQNRMSYRGFGSSRKIALNEYRNPEAQRTNRRIEIKILEE